MPQRLTHARRMTFAVSSCALLMAATAAKAAELPPASSNPVDFIKDVRPIFEAKCFGCHGPEKQKSSFRLDLRSTAFKGGDLGAPITPGRSADSPLIQFVAGLETGMEMPPEGDRLTAEQIGILRRWIDDGAAWPDAVAGEERDRTDWWSLKPVVRSAIPHVSESDRPWIRTPIDAFIIDRLRREGLDHSPEAGRRTLIRRLTFDLHGLPPTPEEVEQFVGDPDPLAYEHMVDRLLASDRYGERWARHWLDVAHYADSHGHDQDRIRPNAWPYRDYLIRALNADRPYAQFVTDQVAGDVLSPDDPSAIAATGFLAAGPFDESSLVSIREDSIDRLIGQYLDRDDIVTSTMTAFTGLTVGCARCHDHKFDPITQKDYYALQAVFAGIDKAERQYDSDPAIGRQRAALQKRIRDLEAIKGQADASLLTPERLTAAAAFEIQRAAVTSAWQPLEPIEWKAKEGTVLKALIDRSILAVENTPDHDSYVVTGSSAQPSVTALRLEVMTDETLPATGPGRAVNGNLHLSEVRIKAFPIGHADAAQPVAIKSAVADFDQVNWIAAHTIDGKPETAWGIDPQEGCPHEIVFEFQTPVSIAEGVTFVVELDQLHGRNHQIGRFRLSATGAVEPAVVKPIEPAITELLAVPVASRSDLQRAELSRWVWQREVETQLAVMPAPSSVFCGTNQFTPNGSFRPATSPRPVHVLQRGDVLKAGEPAIPGTVQAIAGPAPMNDAPMADNEGARRAALARWLVDPQNPLTWRVIVNRVWHYHFGRGLVDTPSDFGHMGSVPSHPELLDWLTAEFRDSGGSLKQLHRLIVTSSAYRQESWHNEAASLRDGDNRLLWKMNRRRLDAESMRDAVLQVSGQMDRTMFGPPVMQFVIRPGTEIRPDADYEAFDVDAPPARRRSIYSFILRTSPDPLLEVLDCPDASQAAPVRSDSVSALQALALWNDKFTLRHAEHLAELVGSGESDLSLQIQLAALRVLGREAEAGELADWTVYAEKHGLANLCRVLLNSSEFLFID
jgi:hypothetical protein